MSKRTECPKCGSPMGPHDQTCQKCGRPEPYEADESAVGCSVCGASISAYTVECPECGETGYPALRPRKGKGFKGSPEFEAGRGDD
ncbi:MAG: zinc ribbon domain-containing protein [Gemmatimonadota bacterium]|nr:zinc ribbon domain-containing protein [Gemmatimonadota bacterium]